MTEDQKKWLLDLQAKGVRFEWYRRKTGEWLSKNVRGGEIIFNSFEELRIPAQSAPDIPDWQADSG